MCPFGQSPSFTGTKGPKLNLNISSNEHTLVMILAFGFLLCFVNLVLSFKLLCQLKLDYQNTVTDPLKNFPVMLKEKGIKSCKCTIVDYLLKKQLSKTCPTEIVKKNLFQNESLLNVPPPNLNTNSRVSSCTFEDLDNENYVCPSQIAKDNPQSFFTQSILHVNIKVLQKI